MTKEQLIQFIKESLKEENFSLNELTVLENTLQTMLRQIQSQYSNFSDSNISAKDAIIFFLLADRLQKTTIINKLSAEFRKQTSTIDTFEIDLKNQVAEFEKRTLEQLLEETTRVNTSFTNLQTTVGALLSKTSRGESRAESEGTFNANEKLLTLLRHLFFADYNHYEITVIDKRQNNNNQHSQSNSSLQRNNKILLTIDLDSHNKYVFELVGHFGFEGALETYRLGTHENEAFVINKITNCLSGNFQLIANDISIKELVFRVIVLKKLRQENLLSKSKFNEKLLVHCIVALDINQQYSTKEQIFNNDHALILHSASINSKESELNKETSESYSTAELILRTSSVTKLIEKIQKLLFLASVNVSNYEKRTIRSSNNISEKLQLESFYQDIVKLKNEIGELYFIIAGDFFESNVSAPAAMSLNLSTYVIDPAHLRPAAQIDPQLIFDLYEKYNALLEYIGSMITQVLKSSDNHLQKDFNAINQSRTNLLALSKQKEDLYNAEKAKIRKVREQNLKLLKSLRYRILPEFNTVAITSTFNSEYYSLPANQFNLIRSDQRKDNIQYKLRGYFKKTNVCEVYILGENLIESELINDIESLYNNSKEIINNDITESLIQICIARVLESEQLLNRDNFIKTLSQRCLQASSLFKLAEGLSNLTTNDAQNIKLGLEKVAEIEKTLPISSFRDNNSHSNNESGTDLHSELNKLQNAFARFGFILMAELLNTPSGLNETSFSYPAWRLSSGRNLNHTVDLDGHKILELHDICRDLSQNIFLSNQFTKEYLMKSNSK